jgi:hypothetical protein
MNPWISKGPRTRGYPAGRCQQDSISSRLRYPKGLRRPPYICFAATNSTSTKAPGVGRWTWIAERDGRLG